MKFLTDLQQVLQSPFGKRIFFRLAGYVLSISLLFFSISMFMEYRYLNKELFGDGQQLADIYAHAIRLGIFTENRELLKGATEAVLSQGHVEVMAACAISQNGHLLIETDKTGAHSGNLCLPSSPQSAAVQNRVLSTGLLQHFQTNGYLQVWAPVFANERRFSNEELLLNKHDTNMAKQLIGAAGIILDRTTIKKNLLHLFTTYLLLNLLFLVLALFFTVRVARDASAPLRRMLQRFGIEEGKSDSDEIARLTGTFDRIVDELNGSFSTINKMKSELKEKVIQRTAELAGRQQELLNTNALLEKTLSDLKNTQSQLVQSEKMAALGQLVAGIAHEINNTINFVSAALPPINRTVNRIHALCSNTQHCDNHDKALLLFDDLEQLVTNISEGADRTARIVKDLQDFSRPDLSEPQPADVHHGLDVTLALIKPAYKHRIAVIKNYDPNIGKIRCIANQLNQVFTNLLLNSIQAIDGEGTITISTEKDEKGVHIRFTDTGSGISPSIIDRIFDPFFTTKEVGKGTGLGLAISYSIIKNHGGEIKVKSEMDKGTEFEIVLPEG